MSDDNQDYDDDYPNSGNPKLDRPIGIVDTIVILVFAAVLLSFPYWF